MLTVDFDRLAVLPGHRLIDIGAGAGRHSFEAYRRGAAVTALDQNVDDLAEVEHMFSAMAEAGEVAPGGSATTVRGDALGLPYPDGHFDRIIASEILEHIPEDDKAIAELTRVLKPGGVAAVTVPRWLPEKVCWLLSDAYHEVEGGHVRIYRADQLQHKLREAGMVPLHQEHAHSLHAPYWWLKCAVGTERDNHPLPKAYHRLLVWDMLRKPWLTRAAEDVLDRWIGKSVVLYFGKPEATVAAA